MRTFLLAASLTLLAGTAMGQEDIVIDRTGVYASDPAACAALERSDDMAAFEALEHLLLTFEDGIVSMEFYCGFYDVKSRKGTPLLFVDAVCELPGELYPDMFAIAPNGDGSIIVVSSADTTLALTKSEAPPSDNPPGTTIYHRCDNLSEIPF